MPVEPVVDSRPFGLSLDVLTPKMAPTYKLDGHKGLIVRSIDPASFIADVKNSLGGNAITEGDLIQRGWCRRNVRQTLILPDPTAINPSTAFGVNAHRQAAGFSSGSRGEHAVVWSADGKELFYRNGDDLIAVAVESSVPLVLGERRKLLDVSGFEPQYFHEFEVAPDGRFLFLRAEPGSRPARLDVILDWFPELEQKVAAR